MTFFGITFFDDVDLPEFPFPDLGRHADGDRAPERGAASTPAAASGSRGGGRGRPPRPPGAGGGLVCAAVPGAPPPPGMAAPAGTLGRRRLAAVSRLARGTQSAATRTVADGPAAPRCWRPDRHEQPLVTEAVAHPGLSSARCGSWAR